MRISHNSIKDLHKIGVYKITNILNNKVYIGSTSKSFISRFSTHYTKLKSNNHKGHFHLQNSVNKYGIENFKFEIIEICTNKENVLTREEYWISYYNACERQIGYNCKKIPNGSPMDLKEVRDRMANTIKEGYKSGRILPNTTTFKKGIIPWNTGIKYQSTDHLKVPKKNKGSRTNFSKNAKEKQKPIDVFNIKGEFLISFRYIEDLILETENKESIIISNMILKNPNGRNGYDPTKLSRFNIQKSCNKGGSYKGLIFKYKNHSVPKIG